MLKSTLLTDELDHLNVAKNVAKYDKMSIKLEALLLQLRLRHTKLIQD